MEKIQSLKPELKKQTLKDIITYEDIAKAFKMLCEKYGKKLYIIETYNAFPKGKPANADGEYVCIQCDEYNKTNGIFAGSNSAILRIYADEDNLTNFDIFGQPWQKREEVYLPQLKSMCDKLYNITNIDFQNAVWKLLLCKAIDVNHPNLSDKLKEELFEIKNKANNEILQVIKVEQKTSAEKIKTLTAKVVKEEEKQAKFNQSIKRDFGPIQ